MGCSTTATDQLVKRADARIMLGRRERNVLTGGLGMAAP
jgi:hypothetical protein